MLKTLFLDLAVVSVHSMTFVEGVPPSKHFRCITQRYVLRSPITQPNIPEEQVAYTPQAFSSPEKAWLREANHNFGTEGVFRKSTYQNPRKAEEPVSIVVCWSQRMLNRQIHTHTHKTTTATLAHARRGLTTKHTHTHTHKVRTPGAEP